MGLTQFRAMPDHAVFINTARGACVDEAALISELEKGRLYAYLDVTDPEPAADDSPLRTLPNVVLTSHIGGLPTTNMGNQAVDDIAAFLRGDQPMAVITGTLLGTCRTNEAYSDDAPSQAWMTSVRLFEHNPASAVAKRGS